MKETTYYIRWRGDVSGPYGISALTEMLESRAITKHHQVSADHKSWQPLGNIITAAIKPVTDEVAFVKAVPVSPEQPILNPPSAQAPSSSSVSPPLKIRLAHVADSPVQLSPSKVQVASIASTPTQPQPKLRMAHIDKVPPATPVMPVPRQFIAQAYDTHNNLALPPPQTSGMAILSLDMGIIGAFTGWMCFGLIFSVLAIIFGHIGHAQISRNPTELIGRGLAIAGLFLGYVSLTGSIIILLALGLFPTILEQVTNYLQHMTSAASHNL